MVDKWGFIDKTGALAISAKYDEVGDFSEGFAWVQVSGKRGYIDSKGEVVISPQYDEAGSFWLGMAEVGQLSKSPAGREIRMLIDTAGNPIPLQDK